MEQKISKSYEIVEKDYQLVLGYLKAKFPLFHNSNLFFRDFQYGIMRFLEKKNIYLKYPEAEEIARKLGNYLEQKGTFIPVNKMGWKLNYPEFVTAQPGDPL